jgi:hypothetical protein
MDRNETLMVMFPRLSTDVGAAAINGSDGWIPLLTNGCFIQNDIDLAGMAQQEMTFATFDTMYQDPGLYLSEVAGGGAPGTATRMMVMEIISQVPLNQGDLQNAMTDFPARAPGMLETNQDFKQIIYGNLRLYVANNTLGLPGYFQLIESSGFGSKEPTAADKLYCYKIVNLSGGTPGDTLQIPASRIGLSGRMYKEEDLEYIYRLKRSYELAQSE